MSDIPGVAGEKYHIVTRRWFPEDIRRHFVGEVIGGTDGLVEIQGYSFIFHPGTNEFRRRPELRTRVLSLGDAGHIVTKLPREVVVESLEYQVVNTGLVVTDGEGFSLDIHEFGPQR